MAGAVDQDLRQPLRRHRAAGVLERLARTVERDIADLRPHLESRAAVSEQGAIADLAENGRREAAEMATLLRRQIDKVREAMRGKEPPKAPEQLEFFGPSEDEVRNQHEREMRQFEADRRSWDGKLLRLQHELESEPEKVRRGYEVQARRLEPVGLIYLWPATN
jgi:hypothetical protein